MGIIVQLRHRKCMGAECDGVDLIIFTMNGDDARDRIVGSVHFNYDWGIGYPVSEDGGGGEGFLEQVESGVAVVSERPWYTLPGEAGQRNHDVGVLIDESPVEICESKEGLNVLDLTGLRPVLDSLDLVRRHRQASRGQYVAEVLRSVSMELALLRIGEEAMLAEPTEGFPDVFLVERLVLGVN